MTFGALEAAFARASLANSGPAPLQKVENQSLLIRVGQHTYEISRLVEPKFRRTISSSPFTSVKCKIEGDEKVGFHLIVHVVRPNGGTRITFPVKKIK